MHSHVEDINFIIISNPPEFPVNFTMKFPEIVHFILLIPLEIYVFFFSIFGIFGFPSKSPTSWLRICFRESLMKWKSLEGKYYSVTSPIFYHLTFWKFDINKSIQFKFHALFVLQELARRREECRQKFETLVEPKSTDVGAVNLRIKLSNGETLQRIFLKTDTLQVYWWLCGSDSSFIYL